MFAIMLFLLLFCALLGVFAGVATVLRRLFVIAIGMIVGCMSLIARLITESNTVHSASFVQMPEAISTKRRPSLNAPLLIAWSAAFTAYLNASCRFSWLLL